MNTVIYYFSGSGNSLAVARQLSRHCGGCEIISMAQLPGERKNADQYEKVGFVFPCHFGGMPEFVKKCVMNIDCTHARYIFAVITHGGTKGYGLRQLESILKKKSKRLNLARSVRLQMSYILPSFYTTMFQSGDDFRDLMNEAYIKIKKIGECIKNNTDSKERSYYIHYIVPHLLNFRVNFEDTRKWDRGFWTNDTCNSCTLCEKICPVGNITLTDKKPVWNRNCQLCMACIQFCPRASIQFKNQTDHKPRYHHPDVSVKDMMPAPQ